MLLKMVKKEGGLILIEHDQITNANIVHRIRDTWDLPPDKRFWEGTYCTVQPGDTVVDVGADIGIFAIHARRCGAARYIGFEPNSANRACLKYNALIGWDEDSQANVHIFKQAVCDKVGKATFWNGFGITAHGLIDRHLNEDPTPVQTVTLDWLFGKKLFTHIDYLKIDCNGSEAAVFDGLSDDNLAKVNRISMQYHHVLNDLRPGWHDALLQRLHDHGFATEIKSKNEFKDNVTLAWKYSPLAQVAVKRVTKFGSHGPKGRSKRYRNYP